MAAHAWRCPQAWRYRPCGGLRISQPWRMSGGQLRLQPTRSHQSSAARGEAENEGGQHKFYVTCSPGLEELVAAELRGPLIGASEVQAGAAGVSFAGSSSTGYRANLWLRCGVRVLMELASGPLPSRSRNKDPVYQFVREAADWTTILVKDGPQGTDAAKASKKQQGNGRLQFRSFAVQSRVRDCMGIDNSMFPSVRAKDAICDACRDACGGARPDAPGDLGAPADVPLFLSLYRDYAVLYRDMSGASLHKRGYRSAMHKASLNEGVAAAMLTVAGWNKALPEVGGEANKGALPGSKDLVLLDPMCGSGTLLIEAALMATNYAPGIARPVWPFQSWHDFDAQAWKFCRTSAEAAVTAPPIGLRLLGNDIHEGALSLCSRDAEAAGVLEMMELSNKDCRSYEPSVSPCLVVVNPPWGNRLGENSHDENDWLLETWRALGRFLKSKCAKADVYVLSGNPAITQALHMRADKKWPVTVGGMECRVLHYHVLPPKIGQTLQTADVPSVSRLIAM